MNKLLIGMTLGAIAGVVAFKKMEDKRIPEKVLDTAKEKLCDNWRVGATVTVIRPTVHRAAFEELFYWRRREVSVSP